MEVLVYLARKQGEVVSREELEREVWRGALVGYDAVTGTVIKLRKALGDSAKQSRIIRTIPKRGYQLVAGVEPAGEGQDPPAGGSASAPGPGATRDGRSGLILTVATLLAFAGVGLAAFFIATRDAAVPGDTPSEASQAGLPSIAVLPFENLSDSPKQDHFADGITEDIITDLSGLSNLLVIASNTSFSYRGRQVTHQQVASDLNVRYLLEGSIRRHGDSVRVNAQLVDAVSGFQVWANRFDREVTEIFTVQDEVTDSIVEALAVNLTPQEQTRLSRKTTNNLVAYDHFREGQQLARISSRESSPRSQEAYRRAIEADPEYGRAYGALAYTMAYSYRRGWTDAPMQTIDRALELAKEAVRLDASIP
jgi:TolB-like protein